MFKSIKLILSILLGILFSFVSMAEEQTITIRMAGDLTTGEVIHRSPALVPLSCILEDDACLAITWLADLGTVSVEIENQSTGEYYQDEVCDFRVRWGLATYSYSFK